MPFRSMVHWGAIEFIYSPIHIEHCRSPFLHTAHSSIQYKPYNFLKRSIHDEILVENHFKHTNWNESLSKTAMAINKMGGSEGGRTVNIYIYISMYNIFVLNRQQILVYVWVLPCITDLNLGKYIMDFIFILIFILIFIFQSTGQWTQSMDMTCWRKVTGAACLSLQLVIFMEFIYISTQKLFIDIHVRCRQMQK